MKNVMCAICKKPVDMKRASYYTDSKTGVTWHRGCYNRTCQACGKRVAPKDRWVIAHSTWHQKCWVKALNELNVREGRPTVSWEDWIAHYRAFWAPGGTAVQYLAKRFPPAPETSEKS